MYAFCRPNAERSDLVEGLYHRILVFGVDGAGAVALAQTEDGFDDGEFGGRCVQT
jgi:hypothetical protein